MKNLLVLALVLSVAGLATAGLSFKVNGVAVANGATLDVASWTPGMQTVEIVNDEQFNGAPEIGYISVPLALTTGYSAGAVNSGNLMGQWSIGQYGPYGDGFFWSIVNDVPAVGTTKAGTLFTVAFDGAMNIFDVVVYDASEAVVASMTIPEPITMVLLGLGGLFLRRK